MKKLEWQFRPKDRRSFLLGMLIFQAGVLVAAELVAHLWLHREMALSPMLADRLFVFRVSIAFCVFLTTGTIMYLGSRRYKDSLEQANRELASEVERQVSSGLAKRNALIFGLAKLADYRDTDTGAHLERIGAYAGVLANAMRAQYEEIDERWINRLVLASSLHDIGKVGIPDSILLKPGRLTPEERETMEKHTLIGADTLLAIRAKLGPDEFVDMGVEIALQHHEKWDGSGYPFGLSGEDISHPARIVALADFYDAVTSKRVYKDAMSHEQACDLIIAQRGAHFDPEVADAFLANQWAFNSIRAQHQNERVIPDKAINLEEIAMRFIEEQSGARYAAAAA